MFCNETRFRNENGFHCFEFTNPFTSSIIPEMSASEISIRPIKTWDEYLAVEQLERTVWQMPDWRDAVPANLLITIHKSGGILLGAFDGEQMIGFVFSFIGSEKFSGAIKLKHCSHMLAVLPEYQKRQVGVRLKFAQREAALAQNIDLMTWTYDPLQALNANLNIVRLGALARRYISNAYGEMTDGLNAGMPSDRFQAEWWLASPRVVERATREPKKSSWDQLVRAGAQEIFTTKFDADGCVGIEKEWEPHAPTLIAEIPARINALKTAAPALALEWRTRTRDFFTNAFELGYACTDFMFAPSDPRERAAYVLTRAPIETGTSA